MKLAEIKESLKKLGFSKAEIEVYMTLLPGGSLSIQNLSKATRLPRTTIALALNKLSAENIISYFLNGKRKYYVIRTTSNLLNILAEKENEIRLGKIQIGKIIPELDALHYLKEQSGIKTEIFHGEEGFKKIYNETLKQKNKGEILRFGVDPRMFSVLPAFLQEYKKAKNKKSITTKLILPLSDQAFINELKKGNKGDLREIRVLDPKLYNPLGNIAIWDGCVAFIAWDKDIHTLLVRNELFYKMMKMIFLTCWNYSKK